MFAVRGGRVVPGGCCLPHPPFVFRLPLPLILVSPIPLASIGVGSFGKTPLLTFGVREGWWWLVVGETNTLLTFLATEEWWWVVVGKTSPPLACEATEGWWSCSHHCCCLELKDSPLQLVLHMREGLLSLLSLPRREPRSPPLVFGVREGVVVAAVVIVAVAVVVVVVVMNNII